VPAPHAAPRSGSAPQPAPRRPARTPAAETDPLPGPQNQQPPRSQTTGHRQRPNYPARPTPRKHRQDKNRAPGKNRAPSVPGEGRPYRRPGMAEASRRKGIGQGTLAPFHEAGLMRELLHGLNALHHDRETLSQVPRAAQSHPWIKPVRPSRTPEALNHRMWTAPPYVDKLPAHRTACCRPRPSGIVFWGNAAAC